MDHTTDRLTPSQCFVLGFLSTLVLVLAVKVVDWRDNRMDLLMECSTSKHETWKESTARTTPPSHEQEQEWIQECARILRTR